MLVAIVSFFHDDELDALDFPHLLAPCFNIWLLGLVLVVPSAVLDSLPLVHFYLSLLIWVLQLGHGGYSVWSLTGVNT